MPDKPFPSNIIDGISPVLSALIPGATVIKRPLRPTDPNNSLGISANIFTPREDSFELIGQTRYGPTLSNYILTIQTFVKHTNEAEALEAGSLLASAIRYGLLFDPSVRVALSQLSYTDGTGAHTERFMRALIQGQRFLSNEINGTYLNLTNTELLIETEIM